jgi:hypothetical protein
LEVTDGLVRSLDGAGFGRPADFAAAGAGVLFGVLAATIDLSTPAEL